MNKRNILAVITLVVVMVISGCDDDKKEKTDFNIAFNFKGKRIILRAGDIDYSDSPYLYFFDTIQLAMVAKDKNDTEHSIYISLIGNPNDPTDKSAYSISITAYKTATETYDGNVDSSNISFTSFDEVGGTVVGTFSTVVKDVRTNEEIPLTDGSFSLKHIVDPDSAAK